MKSKCCNKRVLKSKEENICYYCGRVCEVVEERPQKERINICVEDDCNEEALEGTNLCQFHCENLPF
ncbi:MAG: hypothetical protein WCT51_04885 [Candidatus Shapirobacteria bacterium]|jgi:hypothetical protein